MAPPINSEQTAQQPVTEEAISEDPSLPQQGSNQTIVPEQVVEVPIEPGMSAPSTRPAEGNTSTSRVMEQTKERQPEVRAQPTFTDAEDRGNSRAVVECDRLKEDNRKLVHNQSQLWDHTTKMKEELKSKFSKPLCSL